MIDIVAMVTAITMLSCTAVAQIAKWYFARRCGSRPYPSPTSSADKPCHSSIAVGFPIFTCVALFSEVIGFQRKAARRHFGQANGNL